MNATNVLYYRATWCIFKPNLKKKKKKKRPEKVSYISRNGFFLSFMREFSDIKKLKKPLCKNVLGNGTF